MLVAGLGSLAFWVTPLDVWLAAGFYQPQGGADPWPMEQALWVQVFYQGLPWFGVSLAAGSLAILLASLRWPGLRRWRPQAWLLLLTLALGPGLLINGVLKEEMLRPRPRQLEHFGGSLPYSPLWLRGSEGHSFPCGHCSAAFSPLVLWWGVRARWAWLVLAGGVSFGGLAGVGRMAAGGHFASDVLWSGLIVYGVGWAVWYLGLQGGRTGPELKLETPP